jgi:hypothetical protein
LKLNRRHPTTTNELTVGCWFVMCCLSLLWWRVGVGCCLWVSPNRVSTRVALYVQVSASSFPSLVSLLLVE